MISVSCLCLLIAPFSSINCHLQLNDTLTQCQAPTLGPGSRFPLVQKRRLSLSTLLSLPNLVLYLPLFYHHLSTLQEPVLTSPLPPSLPSSQNSLLPVSCSWSSLYIYPLTALLTFPCIVISLYDCLP